MTATRPAILSAKVPQDLRDDYELMASRAGHGDLSAIVRAALRRYADDELRGARPNVLNGGQGARRRRAGVTEVAASLKVAARTGSQRRTALEHFERAGSRGLTADELVVLMAPAPHNSTARRCTDLLQGGLVGPLELVRLPDGPVAGVRLPGGRSRVRLPGETSLGDDATIVRPTRAGAHGTVYAITPAGIRALEDARAREARR